MFRVRFGFVVGLEIFFIILVFFVFFGFFLGYS